MRTPTRCRTLYRLFNSVKRIQKRSIMRTRFNRSRHHARITTKTITVGLVLCLLSSSTPAASQAIGAFVDDARFGLTIWFRSHELGTKLMALIQNRKDHPKPQEKQLERNQRVGEIQIYPKDARLWVGQQATFSAIAFERDNVSVGGVGFTFSILRGPKDQSATISSKGVFVSPTPGVFEIEVEGANKRARTSVTVIGVDPTQAPARETNVSSKRKDRRAAVPPTVERRSAKSAHHASSLRRNRTLATPVTDPENPYGWNDQNLGSADDPGNRIGNIPSGPDDGGSSSGNFQISAPVISLAGRSMDLNLSLIYNSRVWNKAGSNLNFDIDKGWPAAGWSLGFGKIVFAGSQGDMIVDSDGTRHPFAGTAYNYGYPMPTAFNLHTTDGTMISYNVNHVYSQGVRTFTGAIAYYPNGTIVRYMAPDGDTVLYPSAIEDRLGNEIIINYLFDNYTNPRIESVVDNLGRAILFHYDASNFNLLTSITASGLPDANGNIVARTLVRLHYKQLDLMRSGSYGFATGMNPLVRSQVINVIDAIYYPSLNTGYWFGDSDSYSSYGMIRKVIQQTGMGFTTSTGSPLNEQGIVTPGTMTRQLVYDYPTSPNSTLTDAPTYTILSDDWVGNDTGSAAVTHYNIGNAATPRTTTINRPDGSYSVENAYNYSSLPNSDPDKFKDGLVYETKLYDVNNRLLGKKTITWEQGELDSPRPHRIEMLDEAGQVTATEYSYGTHNQTSEVREYDYGGSNVLRITRTEYQNYDSIFPYRFLTGIPKTIEIYAGDGTTRLSRVDYFYEAHFTLDYGDVIAGKGCCGTTAGNPTRIVTYADAAGLTRPITQNLAYDTLGNIVSVATTCSDGTQCEQSTYAFTPETQYAYPSSETRGSPDLASPMHIVTSTTYDFNTGLQLTTTDANQRTSHAGYSTDTWRPIRTISATGAHTEFAFDDNGRSFTETTYTADEVLSAKNIKYINGREELYREESLAGTNTWDVVQATYDQIGRRWKESLPFRSGTPTASIKWNEYSYDSFGRVKKVILPDGSTAETIFNDSNRPLGASSDAGQTVKIRDPWGRERWIRKDSQGQIVEVVEPNPNGDGTVSSGGLITTYAYDLLGNVIHVVQGNQTRSFAYDSLGRLTQQKLAEMDATLDSNGSYVGGTGGTWSDVFGYDERSNVTMHVDARGVKTSFSFSDNAYHSDPLNRLQTVSYDTQGAQNVLPSASVIYSYMTSGDLTRVGSITTNGISTESYAYDAEGRIKDKTQTLSNRQPMTTTYLYDSLNRVTDIYYPKQYGVGVESRKIAHQDYDVESRLSRLRIDGADYASNIVYNAAGQTKSLNVGNGTSQIDENYNYESETGMLASQTVARSSSPQNYLLNLSYDYGDSNGKRTGQLRKILNNLNHGRDRGFVYDTLGRLKQATGGPSGSLWNQTYSYDRYGNRTSVSASGYSARQYEDPIRYDAAVESQMAARESGTSESATASKGKNSKVGMPAEPKVEMPNDLIARNNIVELPQVIRSRGTEAASTINEAMTDTSTPLYGPSFPFASLGSFIPPVAPQSSSNRIAFVSTRDGTSQLYSMNTDGSELSRLTNDAANDETPVWSPNNSRIVFQSDRDNVFSGSSDIYVMNWDGSGQVRLTSDAHDDSMPVWSPDGTKVAFQSARNGVNYQIYVMNADGSGQVNISNSTSNDAEPSWSPDGFKIAFASDRDQPGFSSIYLMNANGSSQTRLTVSGSGRRDGQPKWSPNGAKLSFMSTRDSTVVTWQETDDDGVVLTRTALQVNKEVYVMNSDGSGQTRLTNALENDDSASWSGDGTKIVFRSDRERECCDPMEQIWVMNADGSSQADLSNNGFGDHCPSWQRVSTNVVPSVSIAAPTSGATFNAPANISILANATDVDGTITKVDFYQGASVIGTDTTAPYSLDWNNISAGSYSLTARATDNVGATNTSGPVAVTVNAAPAVNITSPANGASFSTPANITLTANATDSDGTIARVDFYQGANFIGTATASPYTISWNNVEPGNYSLTARARDNAGATTTSNPVSVSVTQPQDAINLALNKPATQSSINWGGAAPRGTDGNTDGDFWHYSVTHTTVENQPWWQVDLLSVSSIQNINVWNRTDCCGEALTNFYVFVSDNPFTATDVSSTQGQPGVSTYYVAGQGGLPSNIAVNRTGRYVRVQLGNNERLSVAEVQVLGTGGTPSANLALNRPAMQSSTGYDAIAQRGVDGNPDGDFWHYSVTHTNVENQPWWQVDLQSVSALQYLSVWNRTDCCGEALSNFYVFVSDNPFTATDVTSTQNQPGVSTYYITGQGDTPSLIMVNRTGRYVRVQLGNNERLSVAEVQVFGPPPPSGPNASTFVSQSVPWTMLTGHQYGVSVTFKNTGSNTWTSGNHYSLGSQNPQDNSTWGVTRAALPADIAPGQQATFNFTVTAPSTGGRYNFQWRMVQDTVEWFGDYSTNIERLINALPTVSITSPANGATFAGPVSIPITANASDSDGTITEVHFYKGTTWIGTATTAPYSFNWGGVAVGTYLLTAIAVDNTGATTTSAPVNITVNSNSPPTVTIASPANGASFTAPASISISANASDSDGTISRIDFFQGVNLIGSDTTAPYSVVWNNVSSGSYSLTARATDNGGATATTSAVSITVNQPPTANAGGPYSGIVGQAVQFNGTGSTDSDGTITSYQWTFGDNTTGTGATSPHAYSTAGTYNVTLTVTDNSGAQASSTVAVAISSPVLPRDGLASITYDVTNNHITLSGFAYDAAGNLTRGLGADGSWQQYQYDAAGRLVKIKNDNSQTLATFVYSYSNRRVATQYGGETSNVRTDYVWGSEDVLVEYSEGDTQPGTPIWSRSYVYLNTVVLATIAPGAGGDVVEYQHPDQLGTKLVTRQGAGTSFEQAALPFGTALDAESTGSTNRRFTSYDRGPTGLDYAVNRTYNSYQGRFTQVDPLGMQSASLAHPQSLNLYAYCQNDPINRIDSAGTWSFSFSFGFGSGSGFGDRHSSGGLSGLFSFALGLLGAILQGRHIIGSPFLLNPARGTSSPVPPPPKITTVALAGVYSARYEANEHEGSNSVFDARARESTRNKNNVMHFRTGEELLARAQDLSNAVGTIGRLNIFAHAFSPGIIGYNSSSEGLYIGDPGNIAAYHTRYNMVGGTYDYYRYSDLLTSDTRARGARTVEELAQLIIDGKVNIANGGEIVFFGCYTDSIASHLAYALKDKRADIRVTGAIGSVSMERPGYAFTWGTGEWNSYKGDKYQGHPRSKSRSYR
jgi:RHS repeat-associated protein